MGYTDDALRNNAVSKEILASPAASSKKPESKKYFYDKLPASELSPQKQREAFRSIKKYFPKQWEALKKKQVESTAPKKGFSKAFQLLENSFQVISGTIRNVKEKVIEEIDAAQNFAVRKIEGAPRETKPEATGSSLKGAVPEKFAFDKLSPAQQKQTAKSLKKQSPEKWKALKREHRELASQEGKYKWHQPITDPFKESMAGEKTTLGKVWGFAKVPLKGTANTAGEAISGVADAALSTVENVGNPIQLFKNFKTLITNLNYTTKAIGSDFSINYPKEQEFVRAKNRAAHTATAVIFVIGSYYLARMGVKSLLSGGVTAAAATVIPGLPPAVVRGINIIKQLPAILALAATNSRLQDIAEKARRQAVSDTPPVILKGVKGAEEEIPQVDKEGNILLSKDELEF